MGPDRCPKQDPDARHRRWPALLAAALLASVGPAGASVAGPAAGRVGVAAGSPQRFNLDEFRRLDPDELPEPYRRWLEEEVAYIITDEEREVFLRIDNDAQRDRFIENFWRHRDPTPGTPRNEYQELHYERLAYANRMFGRDTPRPGWMTDRGRMYILLGEPMNITRLPNTQLTYPVEVWFYHADPMLGIPPFFYLVFFKDHGMGEYRLYSPLVDGPMKLLNPAGEAQVRQIQGGGVGGFRFPGTGDTEIAAAYDVLQTVDAELAQAAISLIPGEGGGLVGMPSLRSDMLLGQIQNIPHRLMPNPVWAYRVLTGAVEAVVRFETLPVQAVAAALLDPSGAPFIHYAVRTRGDRLNLRVYEDNHYLTFQLAGSLADPAQRVVAELTGPDGGPRVLQADLTEEEARAIRSGPFVFMDRMPAVPGRFRFDLVLENNVSREYGRAEFDLRVPAPHPQELTSSEPLLCLDYRRAREYDPYGVHAPFQVGGLAVLPAVDPTYAAGGELLVFHQILLPAGYGEPVVATYRLEGDAGPVIDKRIRIEPREADRLGVVNQLAALDLTGVAPGSYQVVVDVEGDDRGPAALPVTIVAPDAERPTAYIHGQPQPPASDPAVALARARQYRSLGQLDAAIGELESVLARVPEHAEAVELQAELLMEAGRYEELDRLLVPKLVERPNDTELLLTLGKVNANLGRHYDAIRYYERARLAGVADSPELLNALAAEYYADGRAEKARELLERSLVLQPEQPEVRRLLEEVVRRLAAPSP